MTRPFCISAILLGCFCLPSSQALAQIRDAVVSRRFQQMDANRDGRITGDEAPLPMLVQRHDRDQDGALTMSEFRAAVETIRGRGENESARWKPSTFLEAIPQDAPIDPASVLAAAKYSAEHLGISFQVTLDGKTVYADYPNGGGPNRRHELASGTKTFNTALACVAVDEGWLRWDEKVSDTLTEWRSDRYKRDITVRQLLQLVGGLAPESQTPRQVPSYASAITNDGVHPPGKVYAYGPVPFQCFGELIKRKLSKQGESADPLDYLSRRVFDPLGITVGRWRRDSDGNPHLPSGAFLTADQWTRFGEMIRNGGGFAGKQVIAPETLQSCMIGSAANPAYGTGIWLNQPVSAAQRRSIPQLRLATEDMTKSDRIPADLIFAAGAGKQRLYIMPSLGLTVVRQADGIMQSMGPDRSKYSDREFLERLLAPVNPR